MSTWMSARTRARKNSVLAILFTVPAAWATAGTVHVAVNGVDSSSCGSFAAPCRELDVAVDNARAGDTVLVQPGRYSALRIAKPVRLLSTNGAVATVIDGSDAATATIEIVHDGVVIGGVDEGFTVVGGRDFGISAQERAAVRISGNIVRGARSVGIFAVSRGVIEISDNVAHDNPQIGIMAVSTIQDGQVLVRRNKVYGNGTGISVAFLGSHEVSFNEVSDNTGAGISVDYRPTLVFRNLVTGNGVGILSASFATGDDPPSGPLLVRNTLIANRDAGMQIFANLGPPTLRENNFYGNGTSTIFPNCGLVNLTHAPLNAARSYWGAASGPGAEPADVACGDAPVVTTPFATRPN